MEFKKQHPVFTSFISGVKSLYPKRIACSFCKVFFITLLIGMLSSCGPKEPIVLREIKDVVASASSDPKLKAEAIFYNPNKIRMKLRKIKVDVYINGKKTAEIDQDLKTVIPAQKEFSIPLEVKLAMKDLGLLDTIFGMISGKTMEIRYEGSLRLTYHGIPFRVPVDYKSEIRIKI